MIEDPILRFARENSTWGYDRIQGALANVGYQISDNTVKNVRKAHGIEPVPERRRHRQVPTAVGRPTEGLQPRSGLSEGSCFGGSCDD
ncbi:MAG: transposase [Planctomycetes bacterium]|nr:transposase [Planctomycetota bacterium]